MLFQFLGFLRQSGAVGGEHFKDLIGDNPMSHIVGMASVIMDQPVGIAVGRQQINK